jgi:hypothetical protein
MIITTLGMGGSFALGLGGCHDSARCLRLRRWR